MVLLHGVGQVEASLGLFGDSINLDIKLVHGLLCTKGSKIILDAHLTHIT
jgi:hypothetical protein